MPNIKINSTDRLLNADTPMFFVEKPPVETEDIAWQTASKLVMPAQISKIEVITMKKT
jgi:hypothetical protein